MNQQGQMNKEFDPNGKKPQEPGAKLDHGKPPVFQGVLGYFPRAIEAVSMVSLAGANKYAWKGWESVPDGYNRYMNAAARHITKKAKEGVYDKDFYPQKILHDAQLAWNALAALELYLRGEELAQGATVANSNSVPMDRTGNVVGAAGLGMVRGMELLRDSQYSNDKDN